MQENTVKCTACKRWINKRYSGVRGNLPLAVVGFRYKRSDGTIQEADLAKDLVMDGETYIWKCKKAFVIWDTLSTDMVERIVLLQLESEINI